jgi:hypothetical protein
MQFPIFEPFTNDQLRTSQKEVFIACFKPIFHNFLEGLSKIRRDFFRAHLEAQVSLSLENKSQEQFVVFSARDEAHSKLIHAYRP